MLHNVAHAKAIRIIGAVIILSFLTQCEADSRDKNRQAILRESAKNNMKCTSEIFNNSLGRREFILKNDIYYDNINSEDCKIARKLIKKNENIVVVVKDFNQKSFDGIRECDFASASPPLSNGMRRHLSEDFVGLPFFSIVNISLYAISINKCANGVLNLKNYEDKSIYDNLSMKSISFFNKGMGYDIPDAGIPTVVLPIIVKKNRGNIQEVICAKFLYGKEKKESKSSEVYKACIHNFSDIFVYGER